MQCKCISFGLFAIVGVAGILGSIALTQPAKDKNAPAAPAGQPEMQLPPGWTPEDMQACMEAGTPGKMHEHLSKDIGTWIGKQTMWMAPNTEGIKSENTTVITGLMDGKFVQSSVSGDMPGMGPFHGLGTYGYDNVTKKFVGTWIDNMGTAMMVGTGELAADGKTLTWTYTTSCPVNKKPTTMREVEKVTGPNTKTLEMFAIEPKSGKEYKMLHIDYTRK